MRKRGRGEKDKKGRKKGTSKPKKHLWRLNGAGARMVPGWSQIAAGKKGHQCDVNKKLFTYVANIFR